MEKPVRLALAAGRSDQQAHEWNGHGLLTYFFLEGIRGQADANGDGIVTSSELYAYLEPNVSQTALDNWNARQNPQMGRSGQGEFIFLTPGRDRTAAAASADAPPRAGGRLEVRGRLDGGGSALPIESFERGTVVTYDAGSGLERSRFDWTAETDRDEEGSPTVKITETGVGWVAPFPQQVQWTLEAVWSAGERFAPLWVERTYRDKAGEFLSSLRHHFDRARGTVRFTRTDAKGRQSHRQLEAPPDTITGEGLALWLRTFPL